MLQVSEAHIAMQYLLGIIASAGVFRRQRQVKFGAVCQLPNILTSQLMHIEEELWKKPAGEMQDPWSSKQQCKYHYKQILGVFALANIPHLTKSFVR